MISIIVVSQCSVDWKISFQFCNKKRLHYSANNIAVKFIVFMFVFLLHVSFTLDYNSNSETEMSRKISLQEGIEFCQMSSDEESDFDENVSEHEADNSELYETLYGEPNDKLSENKDEALTSENEQRDDDDAEPDEPAANRQFHRRHKKYTASSIATSLDEVSYDMIDFDNVEAKEVDVPLEKKDSVTIK